MVGPGWQIERLRLDIAAPLLCFVLALLVYAFTLAPGMLDSDAGEFQTNIYLLGVSHTGYPLYFMLAKLWSLLVPAGSMAFSANLFSAVIGAGAASLLYLTFRTLTASRAAALFGAASLALSRLEWSQAVIPDVYTLNSFFIVLVTLLLVLWWVGRVDLTAALFVYGLALTHHRTMIWFAPAIGLFVLAREGRSIWLPRRIILRTAALLVPLALYLYVPLRGDSFVGVEYHPSNNINILALNVFYDLRLQPGFMFSRVTGLYLPLLMDAFSPIGFGLGLLGLCLAAANRTPRGWPARLPPRAFLLLVGTSHVIETVFALAFWVVDSEIFFIPSLITFLFFVGIGAAFVFDLLSRWAPAQLGMLAVLGASLVGLLERNWPQVDLSARDEVESRWREIIGLPLEEHAVLAGNWESLTPLEYLQNVEGRRPDLARTKVVAYRDQLKLVGESQNRVLAQLTGEIRGGRAVYFTLAPGETETLDQPIAGQFPILPVGSLWRALPMLRLETSSNEVVPLADLPVEVGGLELRNLQFSVGGAQAGGLFAIRLGWKPIAAHPQRLKFSVRLLDAEGRRWWTEEREPNGGATTSDTWQRETADIAGILLPPDLPAGEYTIQIAAYESQTGEAVLFEGMPTLDLARIQARAAPPNTEVERLNIPHLLDVRMAGLDLIGYAFERDGVRTGDRVELSLWWRGGVSSGRTGGPNQPDSLSLGFGDREVAALRFPRLDAGQIVRERYSIRIPLDAPAGSVRVSISDGHSSAAVGALRVTPSGRTLAQPSIPHSQFARLGSSIELVGYELGRTRAHPGEPVRLVLYWHALEEGAHDLTVFTHLLDPGGALAGQHDGFPHDGALPTSLWLPGEYVADAHSWKIPQSAAPGDYRIEIGMYAPETGTRLPAFDRSGKPLENNRVLLDQPITIER